jgi:hypothetical protein
MSTLLVQIFFGWPAILVSLALCIAGLLFKRVLLVILGALLFVPFSLYLSGYPTVRAAALLLPLCLFGAAYALYRKKTLISWLLILPALLASAGMAVLVLTQ